MEKPEPSLRDVFLWTFGRGTWQYDLMCGLILAFIFLTPVSVFKEHRSYHQFDLRRAAPSQPAPAPEIPSSPEKSEPEPAGKP